MFPKINPTIYASLASYFRQHYNLHEQVNDEGSFLQMTKNGFNKFSVQFEDIVFDYSKNIITDKRWPVCCNWHRNVNWKTAIEAMFTGEKINETENRAVLAYCLQKLFRANLCYM